MKYDTKDIIYALATPWATGAIAVIRLSGEGCISQLEKSFTSHRPLSSYKTNTAVYGRLMRKDEVVDEVMVTVYRDGHGYTGQEAAEISCHGGLEVIRAVLSLMEELGFRQASRGEFTLRAFLAGKMDLTRAEAVNELINSRAQKAREEALKRLSGALSERISSIVSDVTEVMGVLEVQLDYAEDEISEDVSFPEEKVLNCIKEIKKVLNSYNTGRLYSQGARLVLAGNTNAGKSSLFNLFLKQDRSIVSSTAGTTRDYIEARCEVGGIPVTLYDTAGFRTSDCDIENEGIRRSRQVLEEADLILYLADSTSMKDLDQTIINDSRTLRVLNKTDVSGLCKEGWLSVSAKTSEGFDTLCETILEKLKQGLGSDDRETFVIENERQRLLLERAAKSLEASLVSYKKGLPVDLTSLDVQDALEALGEITGEVTTDDILDKIFETFCVGK